MAPLTRFRADKAHVHGELAKTYYEQRASVPGTLIISEATFIAPQAGGYANAPGIWSDAQIAVGKSVRKPPCLLQYLSILTLQKVIDAVHAKGSFIFLQLWALGRVADPSVLLPFRNVTIPPATEGLLVTVAERRKVWLASSVEADAARLVCVG